MPCTHGSFAENLTFTFTCSADGTAHLVLAPRPERYPPDRTTGMLEVLAMHELAHAFSRSYDDLPRWFLEGVAERWAELATGAASRRVR